jgi:CheY-like chemotaxis protein
MDALPTILVVEDDPDTRSLLSDVLCQEGYGVRTASNGADALVVIRELEGQPCLVLLDMQMEGMSGADVLRVLRQENKVPTLPVLVLSGVKPNFLATAGARLCLHKPIDLDILLKVIERLAQDGSALPLMSCTRVAAALDVELADPAGAEAGRGVA